MASRWPGRDQEALPGIEDTLKSGSPGGPNPAGVNWEQRLLKTGIKPKSSLKPEVQELKFTLHRKLVERMNLEALASIDNQRVKQEVRQALLSIMEGEQSLLSSLEKQQLAEEVLHEVFGLGPLEPILADATVSDILVNGCKQVYVERKGLLELTNVAFRDDQHLLRIIDKIVSQVGRRIDESTPMVDARLLDGSRVNAIIPLQRIDGHRLEAAQAFKGPWPRGHHDGAVAELPRRLLKQPRHAIPHPAIGSLVQPIEIEPGAGAQGLAERRRRNLETPSRGLGFQEPWDASSALHRGAAFSHELRELGHADQQRHRGFGIGQMRPRLPVRQVPEEGAFAGTRVADDHQAVGLQGFLQVHMVRLFEFTLPFLHGAGGGERNEDLIDGDGRNRFAAARDAPDFDGRRVIHHAARVCGKVRRSEALQRAADLGVEVIRIREQRAPGDLLEIPAESVAFRQSGRASLFLRQGRKGIHQERENRNAEFPCLAALGLGEAVLAAGNWRSVRWPHDRHHIVAATESFEAVLDRRLRPGGGAIHGDWFEAGVADGLTGLGTAVL